MRVDISGSKNGLTRVWSSSLSIWPGSRLKQRRRSVDVDVKLIIGDNTVERVLLS